MLVALDVRTTGSEHIKQHKPLQDFSLSGTSRAKTAAFAIVADGHGGEKYMRSSDGSRLAVQCCNEAIAKTLRGGLPDCIKKRKTDDIEKTLSNLCSQILASWHERISTHFSEHPLSAEEEQLCHEQSLDFSSKSFVLALYGTTLLAAMYLELFNFWFALQIGDGKCVAFRDDGTAFYPIAEDESLGFGITTSLCSRNALEHFRYEYGFEQLSGIAVMTDGLTDSFATEKLPDFLRNIQKNAVADCEATKSELESFLPKLSEQGSGDDISIAAIFIQKKPKTETSKEVEQILGEMKENLNSKLEDVAKKVEKKVDDICESR